MPASIHVKQFDLAKWGLSISSDGAELSRVGPEGLRDNAPDGSWGAERLGAWAKGELDASHSAERGATRRRFRAGQALSLARDMLKPDQAWTEWLRGRGIHPRQAWESIKIYEHFGDEAAAATCRITQALIRAGAIKKKQERPRVHQPLAIAEGQGSTAFDDDDPPPAEDPDSVRLALVRIANRLAQIVEKLADIPRGEIPAEFVERSITYLIQMRDHIHGPAPQRG